MQDASLKTHYPLKKAPATGTRCHQVPPWPSYRGTSQLVGTSPSRRVTVYVDPSLGAPGLQNARDLLADADRVVGANDTLFGTTGGPVSVIVFACDCKDRDTVVAHERRGNVILR